MRCSKSSSKGEVYNNAILFQKKKKKTEKNRIVDITLHLKQLEKEQQQQKKNHQN